MSHEPLTPAEASDFIGLILDLYPQQNNAANNAAFIQSQAQTHIERMNQLGFEELQRRYQLIRNLNYTEAARGELKFFADAIKFSLSDINSINKLRKKYIVSGSDLDTLPHQDDHLLQIEKMHAASTSDSEQAKESRAAMQSLFDNINTNNS